MHNQKSVVSLHPETQNTIGKMKQLKFKFDLSSRVALYVPGTINVNETTDNEQQVKKVLTAFCGWFGGATASDARGGWLSQSAGLVIENVTIIYAYCKENDLAANFDKIIDLAAEIRDEMHQEAVTLEINGQIAFI